MDEPLSNLDAKLRVSTRAQIKNLSHELEVTTIYVTHDQIEAMTLADRVVVMKQGIVQQVGSPTEIYNTPANTFVAGFIGNPAMNLIDGQMSGGVFRADKTEIAGLSAPDAGSHLASAPRMQASCPRAARSTHRSTRWNFSATPPWFRFGLAALSSRSKPTRPITPKSTTWSRSMSQPKPATCFTPKPVSV